MIQSIHYLDPVLDEMARHWPNNRAVNIVCHGHSVPAGYFATPYVDPFGAYPHLLHRLVKERFPFAVTNVIVTAIGGEHSAQGAARFASEVLCHRPDVLTIDYGLNDRAIGLEAARTAWESMIEQALAQNVKVILCTPTWDRGYYTQDAGWEALHLHARQIRQLAEKYDLGLADSFESFQKAVSCEGDLAGLLSHVNHPTREGHMLVAREIGKYFIAR